jgi:hypothetical protein
LQQPRQIGDFGRRILRAAADNDQRPFGVGQALGSIVNLLLVDRLLRHGKNRRGCRHRRAAAPNVDRAFKHRRTGAAHAHRAQGPRDERRGLRRRVDACEEIDQAGDDAGLVANLVQVAEPAADRGLRNLPDQREHGRVHSVGREQRGRGIEQAGSRHHGIDLRLAGRERGAERQIGCALLVPRVNGADARRGLEQRVE